MRRGELFALKWEDVDLENRVVNVNKSMVRIRDRSVKEKSVYKWEIKSTKTENGMRSVPLNDKAIHAIMEQKKVYYKNSIDFQFVATTKYGQPIGNSGMNNLLRSMLKKAEVNKNMTLHQLRHTFASRILKIGVDINIVSQWLGHGNISTTYDTYIHATKSQENVAVQLLSRL